MSTGEISEPIAYRRRISDYYKALGYDTPYRWFQYSHVPFTAPVKRLADCKVALVTTAAPYKPGAGEQGPGCIYNGAAKFFSVYKKSASEIPDLRISHVAYDRQHTSATDQNSWFPLAALNQLATEGVVAGAGDHFFGLPTNRSHNVTAQIDCPELVKLVLADNADVCVLVPNCPVCHQSVSVAANQLEAAGIPTVVLGCAKDIVEYVGVPRFVFSDFPLGNAAGKPHDALSQHDTLLTALQLVTNATAARTTVQSPQIWSQDVRWKEDYSNADKFDAVQLAARRQEFDRQKKRAKESR